MNWVRRTTRSGSLPAILALVLANVYPVTASAQENDAFQVGIELGDYRFEPDTIDVIAGKPVELILVNNDVLTPHNLTLKAAEAGLDVKANVQPGQSVVVRFTPEVTGTYDFYCDKKLLFMKSHRDRGMKGQLIVRSP
jgi:plastocyanin